MAIPKKYSRPITVDSTPYRWRIRRKPTYCQGNSWTPLTFAVEQQTGTGSVLLVSLPCSRPDAWVGAHTITVRPVLVRACIRLALECGWQPDQHGNAFHLELGDDDLTALLGRRPTTYETTSMRR